MRRGLITALLAAVLYGALLSWSVAWRRSTSLGEQLAHDPAGQATLADAGTAAQQAASFAAEIDAGGVWEIDGRVAQRATADILREAMGSGVRGEVQVDAATAPADWAEILAAWLPGFRAAVSQDGGLAVIDGQLLVAGALYDPVRGEGLLLEAREKFGAFGLEVIDELRLLEPTAQPELAIAPTESGGLRIAGRLRERQFAERVVQLVRESGLDMPVEENLAIAEHVAPAAWASPLKQMIPGLVTEVKGLQLMVSGGIFLMAGTVAADSTREALAELAGQAFAGIEINIENKLVVEAPPEQPELLVSRGADGVLRLGGVLPDGSALNPILAAIALQVGGDGAGPVNEIEVRPGVLQPPWIDSMAELIPPFAASTSWGALTVHGDEVALEAEVRDPESADVLTALVSNAFPEPDYKTIIEVSVAAPPGPSDEDVMALESAVRETVIYFDTASHALRPAGREKLEALAAALGRVPGSGLALVGHTDRYGNADYNRKLSRKRCETVRSALEEFGVDYLLMEIDERGEAQTADTGKKFESARRVEFELR